MCAADGVEVFDAAEAGGVEGGIGDGRRGAEDDVAAAGEAGGDGEHEHGGEKRRAAAGDVEADAFQRAVEEGTAHAGLGFDFQHGRRQLRAVEGFNVGFGGGECLFEFGRDARGGGIDFRSADAQVVALHAVVFGGKGAQGGVACGFNFGEDGSDAGINVGGDGLRRTA